MLPPLNHLPNCNGSHYTMQLSMYAKMVELILGIPCTGLGLCHIGSPFVKMLMVCLIEMLIINIL